GPAQSPPRRFGDAAVARGGAATAARREPRLLRDHDRPRVRLRGAAPLDGHRLAQAGEPGAGPPADLPPAPLPVGELPASPHRHPALRLQQLQARLPDRRGYALRHLGGRLRLRPARFLGARLRLLDAAGDADGPRHRHPDPALHHLQEHRLDRHALPALGAEGAPLGHRDLPPAAILQADPAGAGGCRADRRRLELPDLLEDHAAAGEACTGRGRHLRLPRLLERPLRPADLPQQPRIADAADRAQALPGRVLHPDQRPDGRRHSFDPPGADRLLRGAEVLLARDHDDRDQV
ncbi:MAG: ABC transporter, permease protein 2 (cluster 1, maltose/g3p/polyamine/iron), partial [uncultured Thermomicrobiales bacterium]